MVQDQHITDNKLLSLVNTMAETFSFTNNLEDIPKMKILEKVIARILQQTAECAFFVREYARRHFIGMLFCGP